MFRRVRSLSHWFRASGVLDWTQRIRREPTDPNETLGRAGERIAANFLKKLGYKIIAQGHRLKRGEIDIVAVDRGCVVFVEVKTWKSDREGDPSAAVTLTKQDRITRAALIYLKKNNLLNTPSRFDVISIVWNGDSTVEPKIRHFIHAFEASGRGQMFR